MALQKNPCGDWIELPAEALNGPDAFRRWFADHHWPFCQKNPNRSPIRPAVAEQIVARQLLVVRFSEQLNHPKLEIIPERTGATWRVLNRKTQSWPIVRVGDYLDVTDLQDVQVISGEAFAGEYRIVETEQPPAAAPEGDDRDLGEGAGVAGAGAAR